MQYGSTMYVHSSSVDNGMFYSLDYAGNMMDGDDVLYILMDPAKCTESFEHRS